MRAEWSATERHRRRGARRARRRATATRARADTLDAALALARADDADAGRREVDDVVAGARRPALAPVARRALRPGQRAHQVGARFGPRRRALLARTMLESGRVRGSSRAASSSSRARTWGWPTDGPGPRRRRRASGRVRRAARGPLDAGPGDGHLALAQVELGDARARRRDARRARGPPPTCPRTCAARATRRAAASARLPVPARLPRGWVAQQYLPDALVGQRYYDPRDYGREEPAASVARDGRNARTSATGPR